MEREDLEWHRFDGTMDIKKRNAAVTGFKVPSREPKVLIVSLKAGGVGLNVSLARRVQTDVWLICAWLQLTNANHVFMVGTSGVLDSSCH